MMRLRLSTMLRARSNLPPTFWSISSPSSVRHPHMSDCLCSPHPMPLLPGSPLRRGSDGARVAHQHISKGGVDAINQRALDQGGSCGASLLRPCAGEVSAGADVAVSRWKGQLRVMIRGWGRWYPVESVSIERIGPQLLQKF